MSKRYIFCFLHMRAACCTAGQAAAVLATWSAVILFASLLLPARNVCR